MAKYNHLEEACMHYSVHLTPLRAALRRFNANMIAEGETAKAGIHGLGVFYVSENVERFVVLDGRVFRVAARNVVKLRPPHVPSNILRECPGIDLSWSAQGGLRSWYYFQSSSRASQFKAVAPSDIFGNQWNLTYNKWRGQPSYVFADSSYTSEQIDAVEGVQLDSEELITAVRFEHSLTSFIRSSDPNPVALGLPDWVAILDDNSQGTLLDPLTGAETTAHIRSRALV